jgi:hypothetical protein
MKIRLMFIGVVVLVTMGCGTTPLPSAPGVSTQKGRDCLRTCQREHRLCASACQGLLLQEDRCLSQCDQILDDCYRLCREEDDES